MKLDFILSLILKCSFPVGYQVDNLYTWINWNTMARSLLIQFSEEKKVLLYHGARDPHILTYSRNAGIAFTQDNFVFPLQLICDGNKVRIFRYIDAPRHLGIEYNKNHYFVLTANKFEALMGVCWHYTHHVTHQHDTTLSQSLCSTFWSSSIGRTVNGACRMKD